MSFVLNNEDDLSSVGDLVSVVLRSENDFWSTGHELFSELITECTDLVDLGGSSLCELLGVELLPGENDLLVSTEGGGWNSPGGTAGNSPDPEYTELTSGNSGDVKGKAENVGIVLATVPNGKKNGGVPITADAVSALVRLSTDRGLVDQLLLDLCKRSSLDSELPDSRRFFSSLCRVVSLGVDLRSQSLS